MSSAFPIKKLARHIAVEEAREHGLKLRFTRRKDSKVIIDLVELEDGSSPLPVRDGRVVRFHGHRRIIETYNSVINFLEYLT